MYVGVCGCMKDTLKWKSNRGGEGGMWMYVGDFGAVVEFDGFEGRAVGGEGDDRGVGDVVAPGEVLCS